MSRENAWQIVDKMSIDMRTEENAAIFYDAFIPELATMPTRRSSLEINQQNNRIIFDLKAKDITAFRATVNSILQFANVVDGLVEYIDKNVFTNQN